MRALCWHGHGDVRVDTVPDPIIQHPRDAIIQITACAICGSDLHLYDGYQPTMKSGDILGHENMGIVVELGSEVKNLRVGDRVVVPLRLAVVSVGSVRKACIPLAREQTRTPSWLSKRWAGLLLAYLVSVTCWAATAADKRNICEFRWLTSGPSRCRIT